MMGARKAQSFPCPANESQATSLVDEICEEPTPTGYHSKDMVTVYADGTVLCGLDTDPAERSGSNHRESEILCGYHELRRHMARHAADPARALAAAVGSLT